MKKSVAMMQEATYRAAENAWKENSKLLQPLPSRFGTATIPEKVLEEVQKLTQRAAKAFVLPYEAFHAKFESSTTPNATYAILDGKDEKTGWPIMYIYCPEWAEAAAELINRSARFGNMKRITSLLYKTTGIKAKEVLVNFLPSLPAELPFQTYFDGSRERVAGLVKLEGAKMYGTPEDEVFAVEYLRKDVPTLTVFIAELDYRADFAKKIVKQVPIPDELALRISEALPHDRYYVIHDEVFTDFERFITQMAYRLKVMDGGALRNVDEGDIVHDLLQGEVPVIRDLFTKKLVLDLDDELPAAILLGNRINVFVPGAKTTEG